MRLGLIGPRQGGPALVGRLAEFLTRDLSAERVVYLGVDGALDDYVAATAERIVGGDPNEAAIWQRAAALCAAGSPTQIAEFVGAQREREHLRLYESLDNASAHAVELLGGKLTLLTYDKKNLEAEDMVPASFLVFGRSSEPLTKQIGPRWFLSPGTAPRGGAMLLDDSTEPVKVTAYDSTFAVVLEETLDVGAGARVKISD